MYHTRRDTQRRVNTALVGGFLLGVTFSMIVAGAYYLGVLT